MPDHHDTAALPVLDDPAGDGYGPEALAVLRGMEPPCQPAGFVEDCPRYPAEDGPGARARVERNYPGGTRARRDAGGGRCGALAAPLAGSQFR